MGNIFSDIGIDSIESIDNTVTELLFHPPNTEKTSIEELNELPGTKVFSVVDKNNNSISVIEVSKHYPLSREDIVIIFSHGNASDIYTFYKQLCNYSRNLNVLMVCYDYPGYGLSTGNLSEENCYGSIESVINYYSKKINKKNIILVGQSLGTGVTVNYAHDNNWEHPIVLISPYKSIGRVLVDSVMVESSFRHNMFKNYSKIEKLVCPVKIIHGTNDEVIPIDHGKHLYKLLKHPIVPSWKEGYGHNDICLDRNDMLDIM
jgi:pimeloyl-ACP methyl ester carboxylesterase